MINRILFLALGAMVCWLSIDYWRAKPANDHLPNPLEVAQSSGSSIPMLPEGTPELHIRDLSGDLPKSGQWRGHPVIADLDGDGKGDLIAAIRRYDRQQPGEGIWVWRGDGKGNWTPMLDGLRRDMGYGGAEIGDLDRDGRPDIAFSGHDVPPHVFINGLGNDGTGSWAGTDEGIDCDVICLDVGLGDCDGDGILDLAVVGLMPKVGGLYVYKGTGLGTFTPLGEVLSRTHYGADVRIVDLDGDGRGEIVAATDTGPRVWTYDAERGFVDASVGLAKPIIGGADLALLAVELDGQPGLELVAAGLGHTGTPSLRIYRREEGEWKTWGSGLPDLLPWYDVAAGHFSPDGRPHLVLAGKRGVVVMQVAKTGECRLVGHIPGTEETLNVIAGDVDGDGVDEIAWVGFTGVSVVAVPELAHPPTPQETVR